MKTSPLAFVVRKLALSPEVRQAYSNGQANTEPDARESEEDFERRAHAAGVESVFCFLNDRKISADFRECDSLISEIGA